MNDLEIIFEEFVECYYLCSLYTKCKTNNSLIRALKEFIQSENYDDSNIDYNKISEDFWKWFKNHSWYEDYLKCEKIDKEYKAICKKYTKTLTHDIIGALYFGIED